MWTTRARNRIRRLVDLDTGECIEVGQKQRLVVMNEGDMHVKSKSIKSYKGMKEAIDDKEIEGSDKYMSLRYEDFAITNTKELKLLIPELGKSEKVLLLSILPYVGYEDCLLKHSNGRDLNIENISKISGLSLSTTEDTVNSLRIKDILYKGKNSRNVQYFVNPWVCSRGNRFNKVLKSMFRNYKIRSLDKKWKEI